MTPLIVVPTPLAVVLSLALLGLVGALLWLNRELDRTRAHTNALLASAASDAEELRRHLTDMEDQMRAQAKERAAIADRAPVVVDDREFVITDLGKARSLVPMIPAPPFVDGILRESVIRTASFAAGLRRALSAETRNRIRFEMKREVKRSRKQRKADLRQARREFEARKRAGIELSG